MFGAAAARTGPTIASTETVSNEGTADRVSNSKHNQDQPEAENSPSDTVHSNSINVVSTTDGAVNVIIALFGLSITTDGPEIWLHE